MKKSIEQPNREFGKISDFDLRDENGSIDSLNSPKFETKEYKYQWIRDHYWFANIISFLIVIAFCLSIFFLPEIPQPLIALVGSVVGYYIAKAPHDLRD